MMAETIINQIEEIYSTKAYEVISEFREKHPDFMLCDIFDERVIVNLLFPEIKKEIYDKLCNSNNKVI